MSTIGTTNTPSFVKIREVTLQFLGDMTWNDPITNEETLEGPLSQSENSDNSHQT